MADLTVAQRDAYWQKTSRLMWTIMALWVIFSFVILAFAVQLNDVVIWGFPLGFYMAAQGSLVSYVVLCVWNASAQNKIDEEFGVAEDEFKQSEPNMAAKPARVSSTTSEDLRRLRGRLHLLRARPRGRRSKWACRTRSSATASCSDHRRVRVHRHPVAHHGASEYYVAGRGCRRSSTAWRPAPTG